jgi:hypothetical protein
MLTGARNPPLKGLHKKSLAQQLLDITPENCDRRVAMMITDRAMEFGAPYRFSINHDVRPPKNLACPLAYDWALKDHVGIDEIRPLVARRWLTTALIKGYTISRVDERHHDMASYSANIVVVRQRAENHQRPPMENDDDDIPF